LQAAIAIVDARQEVAQAAHAAIDDQFGEI
jgi:hypothetical protein